MDLLSDLVVCVEKPLTFWENEAQVPISGSARLFIWVLDGFGMFWDHVGFVPLSPFSFAYWCHFRVNCRNR